MSTILDPLVKRLRREPFALWERIARDAGVAISLPRKLVYGDRCNPRVQTIQPLIDYFAAVDAGERSLPSPTENAQRSAQQELGDPATTQQLGA